MRTLRLLLTLAAGVATATPVLAASTSPQSFPDQIYDQQLQLVRKARMVCGASSIGQPDYQGCLMNTVEYYVRQSGDAELQRLNSLLPVRYRYDPDRPMPRPLGLLDAPFPPGSTPVVAP